MQIMMIIGDVSSNALSVPLDEPSSLKLALAGLATLSAYAIATRYRFPRRRAANVPPPIEFQEYDTEAELADEPSRGAA